MSFSTLMVHLDLEHANDARLQIAGDLAEQFDAKLIGIAAAQPQPPHYTGGAYGQNLVEQARTDLKVRMAETEARFRNASQKRACQIEWRCAFERPTDYVAREARAADVIITGSNRDGFLLDPLRRLDPSDLVMTAGRPIFVVPPEADFLRLKNVLVAWKDTREARRALVDALPLLHRAKEVSVLEVVEGSAERSNAQHRVDDVVAWLARHSIDAIPQVKHAKEEVDQIDAIWQTSADIMVAGAYGHSRLREWVLGGVTHTLLTRSRHCSFLVH